MNERSEMNCISRLVSGFTFRITPRGVLAIGPPVGKIRTKPVPFLRWCRWKPVFRWDECGKSVTWLVFHAAYVPWWLRKPIDFNHTNVEN